MSVANVITSVLTDTSEYVQVVEPEGAAYREPAAGSRTQTLAVGILKYMLEERGTQGEGSAPSGLWAGQTGQSP